MLGRLKKPSTYRVTNRRYHILRLGQIVVFLRWMIRYRDIDFGIWKGIPMNKLVIPLDTHIARISRCIGLSKRKSADWQMAVEITNALKRFDPVDPLKYDFAMCHYGISKMCEGLSSKGKVTCKNCVLKS